jgi:hypothetical protein
MSVTTRTNIVVNGSFETNVTGWTGTNCTPSQSSAQAWSGTKSMALTATTAAAFSVATATGTSGMPVSASTSYAFQVQSRAAATARTVTVSITWYTAAGATISTSTGTGVSDSTTGFVQASVVATSPSTAAFASISIAYNTAAASEVHYVDMVFGEAASSVGAPFDGSYVSAAGVVYAWVSTAFASKSTATTYQPVITLAQGSSPSPNVQITYQDFDPGTNNINVWRTADGKRRPVRGARRRNVVASDFVTDYEAPLGRTVSYDIEVLSGVCAGVVITTATTTITSSASGWLSDPLVPSSAVAVYGDVGPNGEPGLDFDALAQLDYKAAVSSAVVIGTSEPVAQIGQRQEAANVDVNVTTLSTTQATALKALIMSAGALLFRPLAGWASQLPGLCYLGAGTVSLLPAEKYGAQMNGWKVKGDIIAPPGAAIVAPTTTYGTVSANYATYSAFNAAHTGQQYLDVIKNP